MFLLMYIYSYIYIILLYIYILSCIFLLDVPINYDIINV